MVYIEYPENSKIIYDLTLFLATEEYAARRLTQFDDCFFMWRVSPSVVVGRNQVMAAEVNLDYCRENGVRVFRRKSGGGCVYADMGNVMMSYVTSGDNVAFIFNRYINLVAFALRKMGVEARVTGRNDVLVDGRKVSGSAYYHLPGRSIVHGTLLYDTDMRNMQLSITPPAEKLAKNGVKSVRQRIGLLKDFTDKSLENVMAHIRKTFCADETYTLTENDLAEIERIRQTYLSEKFVYGK
ncbi:MAG: lipoate--protein ligase family protein [Bacteroidaceae bacterium]|nr:lipoate--protein ligase family protein [Bacteroidaceae bacterium]